MDDRDFIVFLWTLLWGDLSDGDMPTEAEMETLKFELNKREIIDGDFPC